MHLNVKRIFIFKACSIFVRYANHIEGPESTRVIFA